VQGAPRGEGKEQKFFGSFFQKRTASLAWSLPMTVFNGVVLYVLIWWTTLFAVLPLGTRPVETPDQATGWRGAPAQARLGRKLLINTLVALAVWAVCAAVISSPWLSFRSGVLAVPQD
jgi:predicted secreted protein